MDNRVNERYGGATMSIIMIVFLLMVGCSTTTEWKPTYEVITTRDYLSGVGPIADSQKQVLRERKTTTIEYRCCGPRGSILDFWRKNERVVREKDHDYQQVIEKE